MTAFDDTDHVDEQECSADSRPCECCPEMDCTLRVLNEKATVTVSIDVPVLTCGRCSKKTPCHPHTVAMHEGKVRVVEFEPPNGWGYSASAKRYLCPACLAAVKQLIHSFITPDDPRAARA